MQTLYSSLLSMSQNGTSRFPVRMSIHDHKESVIDEDIHMVPSPAPLGLVSSSH